ncbi:MAG: SRPBCC family protein [Actinomycetota bacterium]
MTDVTVSIEIDRDADAVFAYLADMANNPHWQRGQERCTWTSEPPLRIGSTYDQEARFLGRRIVSSFEVRELEPGRRIRIVSTAGNMPIDVTRTVEPIDDDRCQVTARVQGTAPGPMRLLGPLLELVVRRSVEGDYRRLKERLEAVSAG